MKKQNRSLKRITSPWKIWIKKPNFTTVEIKSKNRKVAEDMEVSIENLGFNRATNLKYSILKRRWVSLFYKDNTKQEDLDLVEFLTVRLPKIKGENYTCNPVVPIPRPPTNPATRGGMSLW